MKYLKTNSSIKLIILTILTGLTFACSNVNNPASVDFIDESRTGTVTGIAYANLDLSNDNPILPDSENFEKAPAGSKVIAIVRNSEYASGAQGSVVHKATIDENGRYSFEIPVNANGILSVNLVFDEFIAGQIQDDAGNTVVEKTFFTQQVSYNVSVAEGLTKHLDISYRN